MAIKGVGTRAIPYVPEEDRTSPADEQTVFWIKPKSGHQANQTMRRYAAAGKDGRKGYRELSVNKLDTADLEEFVEVVERVENFYFSDKFPDLEKQGLVRDIQDAETLKCVCKDLSSDLLIEVFDAANNLSQLKAGEKKSSASLHISPSGKAKKEDG